MTRTSESDAREAKIAELKRLITSGTYETLEMLEEAVDAFLWRELDELQAEYGPAPRDMARAFPR